MREQEHKLPKLIGSIEIYIYTYIGPIVTSYETLPKHCKTKVYEHLLQLLAQNPKCHGNVNLIKPSHTMTPTSYGHMGMLPTWKLLPYQFYDSILTSDYKLPNNLSCWTISPHPLCLSRDRPTKDWRCQRRIKPTRKICFTNQLQLILVFEIVWGFWFKTNSPSNGATCLSFYKSICWPCCMSVSWNTWFVVSNFSYIVECKGS